MIIHLEREKAPGTGEETEGLGNMKTCAMLRNHVLCGLLKTTGALSFHILPVSSWQFWLNTPAAVKQDLSVGLCNAARANQIQERSLAGLKLHTEYSPHAKLSELAFGIKFLGASLLLRKPTDAKLLIYITIGVTDEILN